MRSRMRVAKSSLNFLAVAPLRFPTVQHGMSFVSAKRATHVHTSPKPSLPSSLQGRTFPSHSRTTKSHRIESACRADSADVHPDTAHRLCRDQPRVLGQLSCTRRSCDRLRERCSPQLVLRLFELVWPAIACEWKPPSFNTPPLCLTAQALSSA